MSDDYVIDLHSAWLEWTWQRLARKFLSEEERRHRTSGCIHWLSVTTRSTHAMSLRFAEEASGAASHSNADRDHYR